MMLRRQPSLLAILLAAAILGPGTPARAGTVATIAGRRDGAIALQPGSVRVGGETIAWKDILLVVNDATPIAAPHALRFRNGEVWAGKITGMSRGTVAFEPALGGSAKVEADRLAAMDFAPGLGTLEGQKRAALYRESGNPISGKLLWLKGERLAMDTPIGAVELKAQGLRRYVFESKSTGATAPAGDEVKLSDGSVLRGAIEPADGALVIEHATLGKHRLGPRQWISVRRYSGPAIYLTDLQPAAVETFPLIWRPAEKPQVEASFSGAAGAVNRLVIWPKSRLQYRLPSRAGEKYLMTAGVQLSEGSRGAARLEISVDGRPQLAKVLSLDGERRVAVSLDVPAGASLEIQVDFDERVRFPCGVSLENALLVKK